MPPEASKTFHPLARSTYATQCAAEQEPTVPISTAMLMRHENFRRGVEDVRAGRRPRFDDLNDDWWAYERGRLFAHIAPLSLHLRIDGKLNPKAVALFAAAVRRGYVT
jgi:hypothetical protein